MQRSTCTNAENTFLKKFKLLKFKHMPITRLKFERRNLYNCIQDIFNMIIETYFKIKKIISKLLKYLDSDIRYELVNKLFHW